MQTSRASCGARHAWMLRIGLVVALIAPLSVTASPADAQTVRGRTAIEQRFEQALFDMHQQARREPAAWGASEPAVAAMVGWTDLRDNARWWSDEQADGRCPGSQRLCHNTTANGAPGYGNQLCCWSRIGENVAWQTFSHGSSFSDADVRRIARVTMQGYMGSQGHRTAIMDGRYRQLGIGVTLRQAGSGRWALHTTTVFRTLDDRTPPGSAYGAAPAAPPPPPPTARPAAVLDPGDVCAARPQTQFRDVPRDSALGHAAGCLADRSIAAGRADGTYGPAAPVTRGQMARFLVNTLGDMGAAPPAGQAPFTDIGGHPHADPIRRLHAAGIAGGVSRTRFAPEQAVTREQMAAFLARTYAYAAGRELPAAERHFSDTHGSVHEAQIDRLAATGVAAGVDGTRFGPGREVTRGQMAFFLTRLLQLAHDRGVS